MTDACLTDAFAERSMERPMAEPYYYLWHLAALGVIDADFGPSEPPAEAADRSLRDVSCPAVGATLWDRIREADPDGAVGCAVLIDVGVDARHPNLAARVDATRSIDLASHPYGSRFVPSGQATDSFTRESPRAFFTGLDIAQLPALDLSGGDTAYLNDLATMLEGSHGVSRPVADLDDLFGAHGTAAAGLIVGAPPLSDAEGALPYYGVDPFSKLISVRTAFTRDPDQFIAAFLYAWMQKPDVIVLPRGLPDPSRSPLAPRESLRADLDTFHGRERADLWHRVEMAAEGEVLPHDAEVGAYPSRGWDVLTALIVSISRDVPIVCAAGNDGESQTIYPASLAAEDNGVIAVGAVTAEGFRSGYSNYGEGLTLVAPSDDGEVYTRHQTRRDAAAPLAAPDDDRLGAAAEIAYCPLSLITTDIPGAFGYDEGEMPWAGDPGARGDGGGHYTTFGGTSGASALVGGVVCLAQRAYRAASQTAGAHLDGVTIKTLLTVHARADAVVAPGTRSLTPDPMNADDEPGLGTIYYFGAGLVDAKATVEAILDP